MHNHHPHPKFSIITVTYNAAKVLEDTIQSIVTQTYKNLEYIIVDGGSTDETLDIIHKYQEHITTVISEPDQGLYDAMNKGIKLATGDYLCFLNAGDGLHEDDTLLQMVHSINGTALPGVLYGETEIVDSQGHFLYMRRLSAPATLTWKSFKQGMLVCHQAFFARRDLVEPYDLRYRFSADFVFFVFALMFPDMQVLLMMVLPLKAKWIAYAEAAVYIYYFVKGDIYTRVQIFVCILHMFIFFGWMVLAGETSYKQKKRQKDFQKKIKPMVSNKTGHKCAVCGRTDKDSPGMEFRYCSKCEGSYEYCMDHLYTHQHVKKPDSPQ